MENLHILALKGDEHALTIEWSDGVVHRLTWRLLRDRCPCASCRDRRLRGETAAVPGGPAPQTTGGDAAPAPPGEMLLPVLSAEEARPLRVTSMKPVGNYAYGIDFSDGHTTGIYALDYLRRLGEEASGNTHRH